jgi:secreted PhoX family phosphatase
MGDDRRGGHVWRFVSRGPIRDSKSNTFVGDQLIISVQHPSEDVPIGTGSMLSRALEMLKLDGSLFTQQRTVPGGSNWPGNITGDPAQLPRPETIAIRRKS